MEGVQEVASMLAKAGSFYYKNLSEEGMRISRKLTQLYSECRVLSQLKEAALSVTDHGYFNDFGIAIRFTDKDIDYFGTKAALQVRPATEELIITNYVALAEQNNKLLTDLDREARLHQILAFPSSTDATTGIVGTRSDMRYGLYIDKDIFVTTITTDDGRLLVNGTDFISFYGLIIFFDNPVNIFPRMRFVASSLTKRKRNVFAYTLGVGELYGPIDRIMTYYRTAQTPKTFYYAAAQAIGMCVVPEDCTVISVEPLHKGCSYITTIGKLDAPYQHVIYEKGTPLAKDTVIGGAELFDIILPNDSLPEDMSSVCLDALLPVRGLYAPNETVTLSLYGKYSPAFEGRQEALDAYHQYVIDVNGGTAPTFADPGMNCITFVRTVLAPGRSVILRINRGRMYRDMQLSLDRFIDREFPVGAVLLTENMINNF